MSLVIRYSFEIRTIDITHVIVVAVVVDIICVCTILIVDTQNHPVATRGMLRKQNEDGEEEYKDENRETETERDRQRQTDTDRHRQRQTETDKHGIGLGGRCGGEAPMR